MTITSIGYAGSVDQTEWARAIYRLGSCRYGVTSSGSWRVTPSAGTRVVSIAAGGGWGPGILDSSDDVETLTFASVPTGVRYDMVVMRRTWGGTMTSEFAVVEGGSSQSLPSRNTNVGVLDDQPLALVKVTAGSSAVQVVNDLRVWAMNGGAFARDNLVRSYLSDVGTVVQIGEALWVRRLNDALSAEWMNLLANAPQPVWTNITHLSSAENGGGVYPFSWIPTVGGVQLRGGSQKKTGGWLSGNKIGALPPLASPAKTVRFICNTTTEGQAAKIRINPAGEIFMDGIVTNGTTGAGAPPAFVHLDGVFIPR
ncbi:hypothetical protein [Microbacterium sp. 2FI]|uniref:hypothetical protein n=1 Tax=Microbacterium sp. 2FI TaxID=2502193 RepID=UPI0010F7F434|nr:hypothetical protein [Microbacterium sp. 2FI]